ncbi:hypothetical protein [Mycolicibacterium mengxianglii]|uniref:hypothetical protein n=1 Tax=Mycolicibacterium mengxianglii TaxID=2736649 RepID=UPI0018D163EF|nr:hypothetical protein [Mycolicibacterium mengxianglii]
MTLAEWLSDHDHEWRTRLAPTRLVIETDFSAEEVRTAQSKYGAAALQLAKNDRTPAEFIKRYPALTLMILVGHAALAYDHGKYWESFWDELGMPQDVEFETALRQNTIWLLDTFSLARFPDIERASNKKYVMMYALHAGMPARSVGDLLAVINQHSSQGRLTSGGALIDWLDEPGKEHRGAELDVPVRNFLRYGAEFAADILDRIIEFVEEAAINPEIFDLELDASTTGLPSVLLDELIIQLRDAPVPEKQPRPFVKLKGQPAVIFNTNDDEIVLVLPPPPDGEPLWRVSFDGQVQDVHSSRKWGGDVDASAWRAPVPGPVREILATPAGLHAALSLPLVVKADPLLTFSTNGRLISRRDALKDSVWVVYPDDHELVDAASKAAVECLDVGNPAGWIGWRSARVELGAVTALQLSVNGTPVGTERWVRKDARPSFQFGPVVPGITALGGHAVYSQRPWVMLPVADSDPAPNWQVQARRVGESTWMTKEDWTSEDVETCVDPFDDDEESLLGQFEILVTGPLGADARCVVFLAEGLQAAFQPSIRVPSAGGIAACRTVIDAEGLHISSSTIDFGSRELERSIHLTDGESSVKLLVTPPHLQIRSGQSGTPLPWRMTPDICDPDDFADDKFVAVRAPGIQNVSFAYCSAFGDVLQVSGTVRRRPGEVFEVSTQQFADTVRSYPNGRVRVTLAAAEGPIDVTVLAAQPRRLAAGVHLAESKLVFDGLADIPDLAAHVWSNTAPWLAPESLPVDDSAVDLPAHLMDTGELELQLFVDDPWMIIEPPATPGDSSFRVEQLGWHEDCDDTQRRLSKYLAGVGRVPQDVGVRPEVWTALARLHADGKKDRFSNLITLLDADPRRALECLGDSTIPVGDKLSMFIRSEIVNRDFTSADTNNELHAHPWFGCMIELADLPSLAARRTEVPEERAETLAYLRDRGGILLMELLRTGKAERLDDAAFDQNVLTMTSVPLSVLEAKLAEIQAIPRAQLHPDSLRIAVYEAFRHRTEWMNTGWSEGFAQQADLVLTPIRNTSTHVHELICTRKDRLKGVDVDEHPWMLMSQQSLTFAFLARLEAYGRISGRYLNSGLLGQWARMAQLCPTMVANDLLIAEAAVIHIRRGDLTGEDS